MSFGSLRKWSCNWSDYGCRERWGGGKNTRGSPTSLAWIRTLPTGASAKMREKDVLMAPPARTISTAHTLADNSRPL